MKSVAMAGKSQAERAGRPEMAEQVLPHATGVPPAPETLRPGPKDPRAEEWS
jgi:hypothetical protein